jgi:hypothetical protein
MIDEMMMGEKTKEEKRQEQLRDCGRRSWYQRGGQWKSYRRECKLRECPGCHANLLWRTRNNFKLIQEDLNTNLWVMQMEDEATKSFLQKQKRRGNDVHMRVPQEDDSAYIILACDDKPSTDAIPFLPDEWDMETFARAPEGKKKSGLINNYYDKRKQVDEQPMENPIEVVITHIAVEDDKDVLQAQYKSIVETSDDEEISTENIQDKYDARTQAFINWLNIYGIDNQIVAKSTIYVDGSDIKWLKIDEKLSIIVSGINREDLDPGLERLIELRLAGSPP